MTPGTKDGYDKLKTKQSARMSLAGERVTIHWVALNGHLDSIAFNLGDVLKLVKEARKNASQ